MDTERIDLCHGSSSAYSRVLVAAQRLTGRESTRAIASPSGLWSQIFLAASAVTKPMIEWQKEHEFAGWAWAVVDVPVERLFGPAAGT